MALNMEKEAKRVGPRANTNKSKVFRLTGNTLFLIILICRNLLYGDGGGKLARDNNK